MLWREASTPVAKVDFVVLKPGQVFEWTNPKGAPTSFVGPESIRDFRLRLIYSDAGSRFGLRAWRGQLRSNEISYELK